MGRITVFTTDGDLNSHRLLQGLQQRGLPYTNISVQHNPSKLSDVKKLSAGSEALPQCFFNTRRVGGVDETLKELHRWDKTKKYETPLAKYEAEIGAALDPIDNKFAVPEDVTEDGSKLLSNIYFDMRQPVRLPNGTNTSVADLTEKIKNSMPLNDHMHNGTLYKRSFSGAAVVELFEETFHITEQEAIEFCKYLLDLHVLVHVTNKAIFQNKKKDLYRLHCHANVNVLNSLRDWTDAVTSDGNTLIKKLDGLLAQVEQNSTVGAYQKIEFKDAALSSDFLVFEDAVCELQRFDMSTLASDDEKLAFALNLYSVMLRYAFIKIGISNTEGQQMQFLEGTKFNVGGFTYSFIEWTDGVLRRNRKAAKTSHRPFNLVDRRRNYALTKLDYRVHFGLNYGFKIGSAYSSPYPLFTAESLNEELNVAGRIFCEDNANISIDSKSCTVRLSKLFRRYKSDFATDDEKLLALLEQYLGGVKKSEMQRTLNLGVKSIEYVDVDWTRCASNCFPFENESIVSNLKGFKALGRRFMPSKIPFNEKARLKTVKSLNLLYTEPESRFDRIAKMTSEDLEASVVLVTLMDENTCWFKSAHFSSPSSTPTPKDGTRETVFCGHTINGGSNQILCVENLQQDDRFADSPYVTGAGFQFYAGHPITVESVEDGSPVNIGTLCVLDFKPRKFTDEDKEKLRKYASQVKCEFLRDAESMKSSSASDISKVKSEGLSV